MNADLNSRIQRKLNKNKKSKNMKRLLLVLSLVAVIVTSTVLANPASALAEDVSDEVVQGLESGGNSGSGAQDPVEAADEQTNAQGNEAAPSSDPQETHPGSAFRGSGRDECKFRFCRGFSGCDRERHRGQRDSCVRRRS